MKKFFVYELDTGRVVKEFKYQKCAVKLMDTLGPEYDVTTNPADFAIPTPTKTVRNLMTGAEVEIPANTPLHLDPSSETYWSM